MAGSSWQVLQRLFDLASDVPEDQRDEFLREHCAGDLALQEAVEGLLESDRRTSRFMPRLVDSGLQEGAAPAPDETLIGPYRLVRQLAEGGMGTVYLAERADAAFERRVVLKLIRRGMESVETRNRLRTERRILASLVHPNIARLYDGGTTDENLPYFVMEWIEGTSIDAYCESHQLGVGQRLDLFRKVCAAVHYAHQNLVVHRDLKPSNILVTETGEPKLLDFGIAKLLASESETADQLPTLPWARWLTPSYASPEAILGRRITTTSDVYSLGVLLCKLLTGSLPRRFSDRSPAEIERALLDEAPTKPSELLRRAQEDAPGATHAVDSDQLEGDLDTIVLEALEAEPERRYPSVERFSEDIRRHQGGFPVSARPDHALYRLGKFMRRHRLGLAVAAVFVGMLLTGLVAISMQATKIAHERDQLRAVLSFVKEVFKVAAAGEELSVRQAVDRSAVILENKLRDQPEARAILMDTTGGIYLNLWATEQALEQLGKAVEIRRELYGAESLELAESLSAYGLALAYQGQAEQGEGMAREAVALARRHLGSEHPDLVKPLNNLVDLLCFRSDFRAAEDLSIEALSLAREHLPEEREEVTTAMANRGLLLVGQDQHDEAAALYREALDLARRYLGEQHPRVWGLLNNLASGLKHQGKLDQAEQIYLRAIELERRLFGEENPKVAVTLNNLAKLQLAKGDAAAAISTFRQARQVSEQALGADSPSYAYVSAGLASALIAAGEPQAAHEMLSRGLQDWREKMPGSWFVAHAESVLGESLAAMEQFGEAEKVLVESYRALRDLQGEDHARTHEALERILALYRAWEKPEKLSEYQGN